jgi:hypothetical protein
MVSLRIRVFKGGESSPETTVSIPVAMLRFASWLLPRQTAGALREKGIELEEIIRLADNRGAGAPQGPAHRDRPGVSVGADRRWSVLNAKTRRREDMKAQRH